MAPCSCSHLPSPKAKAVARQSVPSGQGAASSGQAGETGHHLPTAAGESVFTTIVISKPNGDSLRLCVQGVIISVVGSTFYLCAPADLSYSIGIRPVPAHTLLGHACHVCLLEVAASSIQAEAPIGADVIAFGSDFRPDVSRLAPPAELLRGYGAESAQTSTSTEPRQTQAAADE